MIAAARRRRMRLVALLMLRGLHRHSFSLLSAAVLAVFATLTLSSDAFRASHPAPATQPAPAYTVSWAPASTLDPEVAVSYVNALAGLSPLERARQRPRLSRPQTSQPFPVVLPDASEQERAEALLTALADADALGLTLQIIEN
jgi:hypothetical protein